MTIQQYVQACEIIASFRCAHFSVHQVKGGDTRNAEETGEWDGVDLASAPCLQQHVAGARMPSPYLENGNGFGNSLQSRQNSYRRAGTAPISVRPSTPPALLVYKPCLRWVKRHLDLATSLPARIFMIRAYLELKAPKPAPFQV